MAKRDSLIPIERIASRIFLIRGEKVMLDADLAKLYGVPTKRLNEQVTRNRERFPEDFMFRLSKEELENWRSHFATSNPAAKMGLGRSPQVFTEPGVAMLSSVLRSKRAAQVNFGYGNDSGQTGPFQSRQSQIWAGRPTSTWVSGCSLWLRSAGPEPKSQVDLTQLHANGHGRVARLWPSLSRIVAIPRIGMGSFRSTM